MPAESGELHPIRLPQALLRCRGAGEAESSGFQAAAAEVGTRQLRQALEFPPETGPSDWGPIPYLPEPDVLVQNMESQWGALDAYRGLNSTATGGSCNLTSITQAARAVLPARSIKSTGS